MVDDGIASNNSAEFTKGIVDILQWLIVRIKRVLHAGIVTTVLDSACGYAAFTLMPETAEVLTVEFKSNFLRPAAGKTFRFVGEVLKPGKTLMVCEGKAYADNKMISSMSATMMVVEGRQGINRS